MTEIECIQETVKHIRRVSKLIFQVISILLENAFNHDASKLEEPELSSFAKLTPKLKNTVYNSKKYFKYLNKMNPAIKHHYSVNSHHPDYWEHGITQMSIIELLEMLADWKAASERMKNGSLQNSIIQNQKRFGYSDELKNLLLNTVIYLDW